MIGHVRASFAAVLVLPALAFVLALALPDHLAAQSSGKGSGKSSPATPARKAAKADSGPEKGNDGAGDAAKPAGGGEDSGKGSAKGGTNDAPGDAAKDGSGGAEGAKAAPAEVDPEAEFEQLKARFEVEKAKEIYERVETIQKFGDHPAEKTLAFLTSLVKEEKDHAAIVGAAVMSLGKIGSREAVQVIFQDAIPSLKDEFTINMVGFALANTLEVDAEEWIIAKGMTDVVRKVPALYGLVIEAVSRFKTEKKVGFLQGELRKAPTPAARILILHAFRDAKPKDGMKIVHPFLRDPDVDVQVAVLQVLEAVEARALGREYISLVKHKDWRVRAMAIDLLAMCRHPETVRVVEPLLADVEPRVRIGAIQALEAAGGDPVMAPLIKALEKNEGRVLDDIADALARLTGKNFGPNPAQWDSWWSANKGKAKIVRASADDFALLKESDAAAKTAVYFGLRVISKNIAFIIDCSGSMIEAYEPPGRPAAPAPTPAPESGKTVAVHSGKAGSGKKKVPKVDLVPKIDVAKKELLKVLEGLPSGVRVNIIRFNSLVEPWMPTLTALDARTRGEASVFVQSAKPEGLTNVFAALDEAFHDEKLDTIYFLSDGAPTLGNHIETDDLLAAVTKMNQLRKVKINTIGFHLNADERKLMEALADRNYGVFLSR